MNGADHNNGMRNKDPGAMFQDFAEHSMRRYLERKKLSKRGKGTVLPNVKKLMEKTLKDFDPLSMCFIDSRRNRAKFTLKVDGKSVTRMTILDGDTPGCGCGAPDVDEFPCACLLYAADKKGLGEGALLDDSGTVKCWKGQYEGLPASAFKIPGNELIKTLTSDGLSPLPPVTYPLKPGRPTKARVKGAAEQIRKYKRRVSVVVDAD